MKISPFFFLLAGALALAAPARAQTTPGVGIGTTAPDASAALDIVSSTKGALLPRVAAATAIAAPATGLLVYQTGAPAGFYYNAGSATAPSWQQLAPVATNGYVQNQTTATQPGGFNLGGNGQLGGQLRAGGVSVLGQTLLSGPTYINPTGTSATTIGSYDVGSLTSILGHTLTLNGQTTTLNGQTVTLGRPGGTVKVASLAANSVVTTNAAGNLSTASAASLDATTAGNGLTETGTTVQLGGALTQDTDLALAGHDLTVSGATPMPQQLRVWDANPPFLDAYSPVGQSFELPAGAVIRALDVRTQSGNSAQLSFHQGGPDGPVLGSQAVTYVSSAAPNHIELTTPITVGAAGTYSFSTGTTGLFAISFGNPYGGGSLFSGTRAVESYDLQFVLYYTAPTPVPILHVDPAGGVGIGTTAPATSLDVDGGLTLRPSGGTIALTADNQFVEVGNRSYLRLASNSTTATSRTFTLGNGSQPGQLLYLEAANTLVGAQCELLDAGNVNLPLNRTITYADVLTLLWNGTQWLEAGYANN